MIVRLDTFGNPNADGIVMHRVHLRQHPDNGSVMLAQVVGGSAVQAGDVVGANFFNPFNWLAGGWLLFLHVGGSLSGGNTLRWKWTVRQILG